MASIFRIALICLFVRDFSADEFLDFHVAQSQKVLPVIKETINELLHSNNEILIATDSPIALEIVIIENSFLARKPTWIRGKSEDHLKVFLVANRHDPIMEYCTSHERASIIFPSIFTERVVFHPYLTCKAAHHGLHGVPNFFTSALILLALLIFGGAVAIWKYTVSKREVGRTNVNLIRRP